MKRLIAAGAVAFIVAVLAASLLLAAGSGGSAARGAAPAITSDPAARASGSASASASAAPAPPAPAQVLDPHGKYVGLASPRTAAAFTAATGTRPDMTEVFMGWGQPLPPVTANWAAGELTLVSLGSDATTLASIAAGHQDAYLRRIAAQAAADRVPLALDFDHEFNGDWYPWGASGSQHASAAAFVAAWRHMHQVFASAGAANVIWVWSPNVINPLPHVDIAAYWPGAGYVDWAGMVGYWTGYQGQGTYTTLYGPTERAIAAVTKAPILITETGVEQGADKPAWTGELIRGVARDPRVIGFVYFDYGSAEHKRADWTIEDDPGALATWRATIPGYPEAVVGR